MTVVVGVPEQVDIPASLAPASWPWTVLSKARAGVDCSSQEVGSPIIEMEPGANRCPSGTPSHLHAGSRFSGGPGVHTL